MSPSGTGTWTESILHIFSNTLSDGWYPETGLIIDSAGKLYGTTYQGGTFEVGVVFQLVPPAGGGAWTENLLHVFTGASDGGYPTSRPLLKSGHLYGEVSFNGSNFGGLVYELTSGAGGVWTESVLYTFSGGTDGGDPAGQLVFDSKNGNFYGATLEGGLGYGVVFDLAPSGSAWTQSVLYSFTNGSDGQKPAGGVVLDGTGALYGTSGTGGEGSCSSGFGCGSVFKLTPPSGSGAWTETTLYEFTGGNDGGESLAPLLLRRGELYGTAYTGGSANGGVLFQLKP